MTVLFIADIHILFLNICTLESKKLTLAQLLTPNDNDDVSELEESENDSHTNAVIAAKEVIYM